MALHPLTFTRESPRDSRSYLRMPKGPQRTAPRGSPRPLLRAARGGSEGVAATSRWRGERRSVLCTLCAPQVTRVCPQPETPRSAAAATQVAAKTNEQGSGDGGPVLDDLDDVTIEISGTRA